MGKLRPSSSIRLFGQFELSRLYRETISVCIDGVQVSHAARSALFVIACMTECESGICYDPETYLPANESHIRTYLNHDRDTFTSAFNELCRIELVQKWNDRGRCIISLNEFIRSSLRMSLTDNARPALIISPKQEIDRPKTAAKFGYVYIARAENGLHKIGKAKNPEQRVRGFAGAVMPFVIELIHTIESNDALQAESILHRRYQHRRRVGEWFELSERDVDALLEITTINF